MLSKTSSSLLVLLCLLLQVDSFQVISCQTWQQKLQKQLVEMLCFQQLCPSCVGKEAHTEWVVFISPKTNGLATVSWSANSKCRLFSLSPCTPWSMFGATINFTSITVCWHGLQPVGSSHITTDIAGAALPCGSWGPAAELDGPFPIHTSYDWWGQVLPLWCSIKT